MDQVTGGAGEEPVTPRREKAPKASSVMVAQPGRDSEAEESGAWAAAAGAAAAEPSGDGRRTGGHQGTCALGGGPADAAKAAPDAIDCADWQGGSWGDMGSKRPCAASAKATLNALSDADGAPGGGGAHAFAPRLL